MSVIDARLVAIDEILAGRKLETYTPYAKQREFHAMQKRERLLMAGNQLGKTLAGSCEMAMHLTGLYPEWYRQLGGRVFDKPVVAWAGSVSTLATRDTVQRMVVGRPGQLGTGSIPRSAIIETRSALGTPDLLDHVKVRHVSGGISILAFKSYEQGREKWQGETLDAVWFDEEPPADVYFEGLTRTNATGGLVFMTFTPLLGMSDVVKRFLTDPPPGTGVVTMAIEDAEHFTPEQREAIIASYPPYQRDARAKGIPQLGSGAIYPVPEEDFLIDPFDLPVYWPRAYGLDVGWNRTAAIWGAADRETYPATVYLYSEHYRGHAEPSVHADAIRARGPWIRGAIDPAARGRSQIDGKQLFQSYQDLGLNLTPAVNAVEAGIFEVWQALSTGRLRVFRNLKAWLGEQRLYRRDEKGHVVKDGDHLMDATRYLLMTLDAVAGVDPQYLTKLGHHKGIVTEYDPLA